MASDEVITVDWEELSNSPVEQQDDDGALTATRYMACAWDDRATLRRELLGLGAIYQPPLSYPTDDRARVRGVRVEPLTNLSLLSTGLASYEKARLTVEYATRNEDVRDDVLVEIELTPSVEFLTATGLGLYWDASQAEPVHETFEAPAIQLRTVDLNVTKHNLSALPAGILSKAGSVNDAAIDLVIAGNTVDTLDAETVLYHGGRPRIGLDANGVARISASFSFTIRPGGWNRWPKRGDDELQVLYDGAGARWRAYPTADHAPLV